MLDESFYKSEIRDGYTITEKRKKIWAKELEILIVFDEICRKHDLKYYLESGTLIGAVRHQGFIPWDDDIDVQMFRTDYEQLKEICKQELKPPLYWQDIYTIIEEQEVYDDSVFRLLPFGKIRNSETTAIEETRAPVSMNQGIFIDIFPLDDAYDGQGFTSEMLELQKEMYYTVFAEDELKKTIRSKDVHTVIPVKDLEIIMTMPLIERFKMMENMFISYSGRSSRVSHKFGEMIWGMKSLEKKWFDQTVRLPFEGYEFSAPGDYDEVLKTWFGDYMTPVVYETHEKVIFDPDRSYRDYYSEEGRYVGAPADID